MTIVCVWCFIVTCYDVYILRKANLLVFDLTTIVHLQLGVCYFAFTISEILQIQEVKSPQDLTYLPRPQGEKYAILQVPRQAVFIVGVCAGLVACMTVGLVFMDLAEKTRNMTTASDTRIPTTRRVILVIEVVTVISMLVAVCMTFANIAIIFGMLAVIFILVIYVSGFFMLRSELNRVTASDSGNNTGSSTLRSLYHNIVMEILRTTIGIFIFVLCILASGFTLLYLSLVTDWKMGAPANVISPTVVMYQLIIFSIICATIVVLLSVRRVVNKRTTRHRATEHSSEVKIGSSSNKQLVAAGKITPSQ